MRQSLKFLQTCFYIIINKGSEFILHYHKEILSMVLLTLKSHTQKVNCIYQIFKIKSFPHWHLLASPLHTSRIMFMFSYKKWRGINVFFILGYSSRSLTNAVLNKILELLTQNLFTILENFPPILYFL